MNNERVKNSLLFVIALCLVLVVLKLYSGDLVREAEAQDDRVTRTYLYACDAGETCSRPDQWSPVMINERGEILVK